MRETSRHKSAFEYFVELGATLSADTFVKMSERFRISKRTIENWSSKYGWIARADRISEKIHEKHLEKLQTDLVKIKDDRLKEIRQNRALIRASLNNALVRDKENNLKSKINPTDSKDLASLIKADNESVKLELLLLGEATERNDGIQQVILVSPAGKRIAIDDDP